MPAILVFMLLHMVICVWGIVAFSGIFFVATLEAFAVLVVLSGVVYGGKVGDFFW